MSSTTELGYPIWDPVGDDLNENVYSYFNSITGAQSTSAMRLLTADLNALNNTKLTIYSKTAAEWSADITTVIMSGEFGIETDTGKIKFGNGVDIWSALHYFSSTEVLTGLEDPTTSIPGKMGQTYINTNTPSIWQYVDNNVNTWVMIYPQSAGGVGSGYTPVLSLNEVGDLYVEYQETAEPPVDVTLGNIMGPSGESGVYYGPVNEAPEDATVIVDPAGGAFTTDNVPEGEANKYYTDERVDGRLAQYKIGTTANLPVFTGEGGTVGVKTAAEAIAALGAAKAPVTQTVTLLSANWTAAGAGYYQIVDLVGMRSTLIIAVSPDPDNFYGYTEANIYCSIQSYDALAFNAKSLPSDDLTVNILILG